MFIEPQLGSNFEFCCILVIVMRRTGEAPLRTADLGYGSLQVINATMEVIGRTEEDDWTGYMP